MCLECSGRHRALGVHISFVRSVAMDSWTEKQISIMRRSGNAKFTSFLAAKGVQKSVSIPIKYNSPVASYYRECLLAETEGRDPPSEPPPSSTAVATGTVGSGEQFSLFASSLC
jgi:ADP-ribosylation factor GTPase-activating protein 1